MIAISNLKKLRMALGVLLKPHGKWAFLKSVVKYGKVLDVGCGNNSPLSTKQRRPDIHYTGIDVSVYNQTDGFEKYADRLVLTSPESFPEEIEKFRNEFDAVISSHNLEHCNDQTRVLLVMINSLKKSGYIYLSFPCEKSAQFPSRRGTLNFYDDASHQNLVPYDEVIAILRKNHVVIDFTAKEYKPCILAILGFIFEPASKLIKRKLPFGATWAYYGFESVIIGHKQ